MESESMIHKHAVVSQDEWTNVHTSFLEEEKELTRLSDRLKEKRRQLPWVKIEKNYVFEGENGSVSFSDLFDGKSQLIIQHFMFGPNDTQGCPGCSFTADHVDSARLHFEHNDLAFAAVSRGEIGKLLEYKKRMGWTFNWVSSFGSDFNYDFHVSFKKEDLEKGKVYHNFEMIETDMEELPGTSVFYKNEAGDIFHTCSFYGRGAESLVGAYNYLDLTPKGRNEYGPDNNLNDWVRRHDEYEVQPTKENSIASCCSSSEVGMNVNELAEMPKIR